MRRRTVLAALAGLVAPKAGGAVEWQVPPRRLPAPALTQQGHRAALVVGISRYLHAPALPSAVADAQLVGGALQSLGFDTTLATDLSQQALLVTLARFRMRAAGAGTAVIYVAAHGVMAGGQSQIVAADTPMQGLLGRCVPESALIAAISDRPRHKLLFLDACRELPGLTADACAAAAPMHPAGVHVSYAAQPGAPALDGAGHSPFAQALARGLAYPGLDTGEMARRMRLDVLQATNGHQIPWERSSLLVPVVLNPGRV